MYIFYLDLQTPLANREMYNIIIIIIINAKPHVFIYQLSTPSDHMLTNMKIVISDGYLPIKHFERWILGSQCG